MSRSTSATFRDAVYRPETGEVYVLLLTVNHDDLTTPIRVSTDNNDTFTVDSTTVRGTISNGNNFIYLPMEITLPDDSDESISQAKISIDNIDRDILRSIRSLESPPTVSIQVVLASSPNTYEAQFNNFVLRDVTADSLVISGTLSLSNFLNEPFPGGTILPSNFPGIF
ncbi:MAG: DUF1833 family protein [Melioribacteraceae bacterium]